VEEDKGNGKIENSGTFPPEKPKFKYQIKILFNDETGEIAFETNVPNAIIGYGMLEFGKKGVDNHIAKAQAKILPSKGGMFNFARGRR
jgi:hypothetical protein